VKSTVKVRVMHQADLLISRHGYAGTAVRDIIHAAGIVPASFYDHFASKKALGLAYLKQQEDQMLHDLSLLMEKYPNPKDLPKAWVILKLRQISRDKFWGCPFAKFAMHIDETDTEFREALRLSAANWLKLIEDYFQGAVRQKLLKGNPDIHSFARRILTAYEGHVAMWRITGDLSYVRQMQSAFEAIYEQMANSR
jgi:AcrR family transcriptional regulator